MQIAVSVVVPVYNASRYLNQCIDSLINQSLKDVEFIFVDDGSTDNSIDIIKQYQEKDDRIFLLQQENLYAGVARNNGMEKATGKYIIFLDSDDFFDLNMLRDAYICAEKHQVEIVLWGYRLFSDSLQENKKMKLIRDYHYPKGIFSAEDLGDNKNYLCYDVPWNKLFLREFVDFHHLRFEAVKKSNDTYFTHMAMALASKLYYIDKKYVNYRTDNPSSLQGMRNTDRRCFIDRCVSIKKGLTETGKYNGAVRQFEVRYTQAKVKKGISTPFTKEELEDYYTYAKKHLIPDLFDSPADLGDDYTVKNIYESSDFSDFLCRQLQAEKDDKKNNYVMATSWEVRVGRFILTVPKAIIRHFKG